MEMILNEVLYGDREVIKILDGKGTVSKAGPSGLGMSSHRPASAKTSAKYSGVAKILDMIIVDKKLNALESETFDDPVAYCEFGRSASGEPYYAFFTQDSISYNGKDLPTGYEALAPVVTFALSNASDNAETSELKEIFKKIVADYNSKGVAEISDVLKFCDSFYYGFAVNHAKIDISPDDFMPEVVKSMYTKKIFELAAFMEDVEGKPAIKILEGIELREGKKGKAKKAKATSQVFEDCLEGKAAIPYEWDEKQQLKIPSLSYLNGYVPTQAFYSVKRMVEAKTERVIARLDSGIEGIEAIGNDYINIFTIGKPGTGKTTLWYALGAALRMPVYSVPITKNTEEDTFQGMTKVVDGGFKFVSTEFLEAYTHGGIIILEEINLADPSVIMGSLGQAVEAPFVLMQDGYKPVRRHPMCIVVGTMNIATYGSKGVSQALSSRFKQTYILDDPKKEDFIAILAKQGYADSKCKWVYDAYTKIINHLKSPEVSREEICLNVTLRGCLGALECIELGDTPQQAIYNTLVGKIAEVDMDLADDINKNVVKTLPNLSV